MSLKIRIRRHQFIDKEGQNVILNCSGENVATWEYGNVDSTWHDITEYVDQLDDLEIIVRQNQSSEKSAESGATLQVNMMGEAACMIDDWLFDTPCSYINFFDVEIEDTVCGITYRGYELKPDNLEWCDGDGKSYSMSLREGEDKYRELRKLSIHDNWQKWFSEDGSKNHPTFQVVLQQEPTAIGMKAAPLLFLISIPGLGLIIDALGNVREKFKKIIGFGRYHAAPKIHDILLNACMKIGLNMDTPFDAGRELHNDCLFIPYSGIYHTNFNDDPEYRESPSTKHIWNNRYIWQVTDFLDELCKLYAMKWDIVNGTLKVEFLKDILSATETFEITDADTVCYEFDLTKKPSYGRYEYSIDGADSASNQVQILYNDIVDYDGVAQNPMLEGDVSKQVKFASTGFYGDGFGENYIAEVVQVMKMGALAILASLLVASASLIISVVPTNVFVGIALGAAVAGTIIGIIAFANNVRGEYGINTQFAGIIRIWGSGEVTAPRIIRWDTSTPLNNAKAVVTQTSSIAINSRYNTDSIPYQTYYSGTGTYITISRVWNYPLYFDSFYLGNLYDNYHEIVDNPMIVNIGHQQITAEIPMCCENIDAIGTSQESTTIVGRIVKVKDGISMYVTEAIISYEKRSITLKGKIIRR